MRAGPVLAGDSIYRIYARPYLFLHFCLVLAKKNTWLTRPRLALLYLPAAGDTLYLLLAVGNQTSPY
jgi:hypothetical protein